VEWKTVQSGGNDETETTVLEISGVGCVVRFSRWILTDGDGDDMVSDTMCFVPGASLTNDPAHPGEWRMEKR